MDFKELRESLSVEDINYLLEELGVCPLRKRGTNYITETFCHNAPGEGSHKLYYYPNSHLWQCYTECQCSFDIFELIVKHKAIIGEQYSLTQAIQWVEHKLGYNSFDFTLIEKATDDFKILNRYKEIKDKNEQINNQEIKTNYLANMNNCVVSEWVSEGISKITHLKYGIRYYPVDNCIIIPHYNKLGQLIGIRQRTIEQQQIELWGKYRPARINGEMFNHHLGSELFGLNFNKETIRKTGKAIITEGEKSVMLADTLLGDASVLVACCGSNISKRQVDLLLELGVNEMIVAFDKEFKEIGDIEYKRNIKMLESIHRRFSPFLKVSFLFDKEGILSYKSSPIDEGLEKFIYLFNNRITLEEE
jgi:hypothetical protein